MYTQRVKSLDVRRSATFEALKDVYGPAGRVLQLVRVQSSCSGGGDVVVNHVLSDAAGRSDVDSVAAVTRCREFDTAGDSKLPVTGFHAMRAFSQQHVVLLLASVPTCG